MTAKKKEDLLQPKRRTAREQYEALERKGAFGMWQDLIPADLDSVEFARMLRAQAETRGLPKD